MVLNELHVRFLGSCIEEIGKHSFPELRGPTIISNDVERLSKDPSLHQGLADEATRHRAVIYMSVLSARNCSCANWFYRTMLRTDRVENLVTAPIREDNMLSELLLLFTLCLYHPAFTFEQKTYFGKLLEKLIAQYDGNKFNSCNIVPGFLAGVVNPPRNISSLSLEAPSIPVKTPIPVDTHIQHPPPGLPHPHALPPHIDLSLFLQRTNFPATVVGTPEVHPFSPQPVSPLVSQATSPPQSRASSPHRTYGLCPLTAMGSSIHPGLMGNLHHADTHLPMPHLDPPLSQPPSLIYNSLEVNVKNNEDDVNHIPDDKLREPTWLNQPPNGIRYYQKCSIIPAEQMQNLKLEQEHCSSSASSNNSSMNQSPTETPSVTPAVTPHGPGRGGGEPKARVNGMPPPQFLCEINPAQPPPPQQQQQQPPPFTNCTVPSYSISHVPPNRYYQAYRPHYTTPFQYQSNEVFTSSPFYIYSSAIIPPPPPPPRNPNCYNCGGMGHMGVDCNGHTVEDITQKPYALEYDSPTIPDNPPDK